MKSSRRRQVAIFLGAGASRAMGLPLTAEILPRIARRRHDGSLFENWYPEHAQDLRSFFARSFPQLLSRSPKKSSVIELLTSLDHYLRDHASPWKMNRHELKRYRLLLVTAICEILYKTNHRIATPARARWSKLLRTLPTAYDRRIDLAIITTNYDQLVDELLLEAFGSTLERSVDMGVTWYDRGDTRIPRPRRPKTRYYKIQGSMNSLVCQKCGRLYINTEESIYLVPFQSRNDDSQCGCGHYPLAHTVVAPSAVSQIPFKAVKETWQCAGEFLRRADEWLFVGYSLPAEDVALRDMILRAFSIRKTPPRIDVVVLNENSAEADRYRFYFARAKTRCRIFGGGLESYLRRRNTIASTLYPRAARHAGAARGNTR
jgi:NAD-dependent SIR2 family protein deacetylase